MAKHDIDVYRLALQMAGTGQFADWRGLQQAMLEQGIGKAPRLLDNDKIRVLLDFKCEQGCAARH